MGILDKIFRNKTPTGLKLMTEMSNGFYSWQGNIYQSDIVRACIRPKAKAIGKMAAKHLRNNANGELVVNPDVYMKFLLEEPNPFMTGQMLQEKLATQLELNNNAFALIIRDENGLPQEMYPIISTSVTVTYDDQARMQLKFIMDDGSTKEALYSDIIHLRQDFNESDIFGESPQKALKNLMDVVNTTDQGIIRAIKNSGVVKWMLKFKMALHKDDKDKQREEFAKENLEIGGVQNGVLISDGKYDAEQVKPYDYVPNAAQMDRTTARIYNFFGTNEKIVQSKWSEDDWNAYYEAQIEPIAKQLAGEYTRKLFNRKQRGFTNRIIFESISLQTASMSNKLTLFQMVDRGAMTPNEWREILNLGPVKGGNELVRRLDTAVVKGEGK